tara:strand:+ start:2923 stop:3393 length:471 start_codon:yes stop_codon:yes gene_type:complete
MKVQFWVIGKTTDAYLLPGIHDYFKRLRRYCQFEYVELPAAKIGKNATETEIKNREERAVLEKLQKSDFLVLMDANGQEHSSENFASFLSDHQMRGTKNLVFLIGGAYGFSNQIYQRANSKFSLSKMTFTHQMVRLIFLEQLYRAYTITKGEKYHH